MSKRTRVEFKPTIYIDLPTDCDNKESAILDIINKFNELNIASVNIEITQNDGSIHIGRADDWEIGDYEFIDEED